jgi:ribosomal protein S6
MRSYETVAVLSVAKGEQDLQESIKRLETLLTAKGSSNLKTERVGTKELGYVMRKQAVGHYVYFKFDVTGETETEVSKTSTSLLEAITHAFRIDDEILKFETHRIGLAPRKFKGRIKAHANKDSDDFSDLDLSA